MRNLEKEANTKYRKSEILISHEKGKREKVLMLLFIFLHHISDSKMPPQLLLWSGLTATLSNI